MHMAAFIFEPMAVPLREDEHGAIRVGDTRVLLDLVIQEFRDGATPEEIVEAYDALQLADVYAAITYYLRHSDTIEAYLDRREQEANAIREMIEASQPPRPNLRATLMARARAREKADAQTD
ncbi:MAG TPA: DUF433 domain-containing protein [Isosphaeraceae bacterium]|nr:DUF433 domain-containing protein [Isosphaeraceae bacterium]